MQTAQGIAETPWTHPRGIRKRRGIQLQILSTN